MVRTAAELPHMAMEQSSWQKAGPEHVAQECKTAHRNMELSFCHFEELGFVLCSARFVSSFVRLCNYTRTTVAVSSIQNSGKRYKQRGVARYSNLHPHTQYTYIRSIAIGEIR